MTIQEILKNVNYCLETGFTMYLSTKEDVQTIKNALEKQIPKKPKSYLVNMKHIDFLCPNCKKRIISKVDGEWLAGKNQKFCDECGKALDWSVKE